MSLILKSSSFSADDFSQDQVVKKKVVDSSNQKTILFHLKKGQVISAHTSPMRVNLTVLKGNGDFLTGKGEESVILNTGESILLEPMELHGFTAHEDMVVQAILVP